MDKMIIYGAGVSGVNVYRLLRHLDMHGAVHCFCDRNARAITLPPDIASDGKEVRLFEETLECDLPYVISAQTDDFIKEIEELLKKHGKRCYGTVSEWLEENDDHIDAERLIDDVGELENNIYFAKRRMRPERIFDRTRKIKVRISHIFPACFNSLYTCAERMARRDDVDMKFVIGSEQHRALWSDIVDQLEVAGLSYEFSNRYDITSDRPDIFVFNIAHAENAYQAVGGFEKIDRYCRYISVIPYTTIVMDAGISAAYKDILSSLRYDSLIVSRPLYERMFTNLRNVVCMPNPKFDIIYRELEKAKHDHKTGWEKLRGRRAILWAPDHGMNCHGIGIAQCVDVYFSDICNYFKEHSDTALIIRPNPSLVDELICHNIWSEQDYRDVRAFIDSTPNIIWDDTLDHARAFAASDAVMVDSACGIIYSYLPMKKPILLTYRNRRYDCDWNPELTENYYKAYEWAEVKSFIEMVASGEDPLYEARMKTIEKFIPDFDGRCGERIAEFIMDDYFKKYGGRTQG